MHPIKPFLQVGTAGTVGGAMLSGTEMGEAIGMEKSNDLPSGVS